MRAVVVLPGRGGDGPPVTDRHAGPLLWVVDRPLAQHACEALVGAGVTVVDWVYPRPDEAARRFLGGGERWGLRFQHYDLEPGGGLYEAAGLLLADGDRPVLFGHADRVVDLSAARSAPPTDAVLFGERDAAGRWGWGGWALFDGPAANHFPRWAATRAELGQSLTAGRVEWAEAPAGPAPRCLSSYLAATRAVLAAGGGAPRVPRSARVHPTARLVGPVHLGADVEVGPGAVVGPFVAVGPNSVIDRGAVLADAVVLPDTYVGPGLRLDGGLIDRHRVVGVGPAGRPVYLDGMAAGSLTDHRFGRWAKVAGRTAAAAAGAVARLVAAPARLTGPGRPAAGPALGAADGPAVPEPAAVV